METRILDYADRIESPSGCKAKGEDPLKELKKEDEDAIAAKAAMAKVKQWESPGNQVTYAEDVSRSC